MSEGGSLVLGVDLGTSYFKAGLFDRAGGLRGMGRAGVEKEEAAGGRCELPVERFWKLVRECVGQALRKAQAGPGDIRAVGYSSQANSFLLSDRNREPLTPLVLWPDLRAADMTSELHGLTRRADFLEVTGLGIETPELCIAKLFWYQQHCPELWGRVSRVRTISDYLVEELTDMACGDEGTASLLGLWDLRTHDWWDDALRAAGLSRAQLSRPLAPGSVAGTISARGAALAGLAPGTPLAVGSLDHHVAALGAGVGHPRHPSVSLGTVVACLCGCDAYRPLPGCCMGRGTHGCEHYQIAFDGNGTGGLDWYAREEAGGMGLETLTSMAGGVAPGSDGLFALPSPQHFRRREGFLGASDRHSHAHCARAIMESTAASVRSLLGLLRPEATFEFLTATGGGARNGLWLQIVADVTGLAVRASAVEEPASLGAAMMAGVAAGWFDGLRPAAVEWCKTSREFLPDPGTHALYMRWYADYLRRIRDRNSGPGGREPF